MQILGGSARTISKIRARLIAQQLTVSTQDGDDRVVLQSTKPPGGVRIETGAGNDTVSVIGTIVIHGSETGANTVRFGATADAGGALDGNGLLTQGNTMQILGGSARTISRSARA